MGKLHGIGIIELKNLSEARNGKLNSPIDDFID
jgi:hypothetical protein